MIFQFTWEKVLDGSKSQTRRVIDPHEMAVRGKGNRIEAIITHGREKWRVGKTYAVQPGRGKKQVGRIRITSIRQQRLDRISPQDSIAEGFSSRQDFLHTWDKIHGSASRNVSVWVIAFELVS